MRVLVTGGAGYIGAQVVRHLCRRGDEVTVLDDLSTGNREAIEGVPLIVASITDAAAARDAIRVAGADAIVHLAALKSVEESVADPGLYFATNVGGTVAVLDAAVAAGVRAFVFSSSCAVYGTPERLPVDEDVAIRPDNPYGESKALGERTLPWFERRYGIRTASLRYFNAAGADPSGDIGEEWEAAANLIPRAMRAARTGVPLEVYGTDYDTPDGTAIRDYIHVVDLATAHLAALDHLAAGGTSVTLNLGTGRGSSVRQIVSSIERLAGRAVPVREVGRRAGDPAAVWADASRAERVIGWRARHDLDDIVRSAWRWHSLHPEGFARPPTGHGE